MSRKSNKRSRRKHRTTGYVPYHEYINSQAWMEKRKKRLHLDGVRKCRMCKSFGPTQLHHRTYARLGDESMADLVQLCAGCHELLHEYCTVGRGKPSKIHKRLGRLWSDYVNEASLWSVRKHHPEEFKRLAHEFFHSVLSQSRKGRKLGNRKPMPDTKVEWLIAEHGEDTQPPKLVLTPYQERCLSFVASGGAISDRGRSPVERRELQTLTEAGKLRFGHGMYSLMTAYDEAIGI